LNSSGTGVINS